ncbi:MAG TPA: hypothetical protein VE344_00645 [Methylomirabilota bacterium]|nr:hypothetical protein [Methylomirabilota bacterium]
MNSFPKNPNIRNGPLAKTTEEFFQAVQPFYAGNRRNHQPLAK